MITGTADNRDVEDFGMRGGRPAFSLGRFGLPVNVLAMLWSVFMVVNVGWPRTLIYGEANRFALGGHFKTGQ